MFDNSMQLNLKTLSFCILTAAALVAVPLTLMKSANADGGGCGSSKLEQLDLTGAQSSQIEVIRTETRSQIEAVLTPEQRSALGDDELGRGSWRSLDLTEEQRNQIRTIKDGSREQISTVLTEEQRQEITTARAEGKERGRGRRFEALNLTDEQSAQIEAIRAETKSQMEALLTPEQQATLAEGNGGRRGFRNLDLTDEQRQQVRAIHDASHKQMDAVLTEVQRQQLNL